MGTFCLPDGDSSRQYIREFREKVAEAMAADGIRQSPAALTNEWKQAGRVGRSLVMRASAHGLHSGFCRRRVGGKPCFEEREECECKYCEAKSEQYHLWPCKAPEAEAERTRVREAQGRREYVNFEDIML